LIDQNALGVLPENVFAFKKLPQLKVLAYADCSINHGGIHTINECIHYKVPMLIYSGKRSDQNGCAARVAFHQLGIMADKDKDQSAAIQSKIQQVLTDPLFRKNMEKINREYIAYKKEGRLEKIINEYLTPRISTKTQVAL